MLSLSLIPLNCLLKNYLTIPLLVHILVVVVNMRA